MQKEKDITEALNNIKELMDQKIDLSTMQNDTLELTEVVELNNDSISKSQKLKSINNSINSTPVQHEDLLQDVTVEALKPYIKDWLDHNLPNIVKEIVDHQIKLIIERSNH